MAQNKYEEAAFNAVNNLLADSDCDLLEVQWRQEQGEFYLTFIIDKSGGVDLSDCERVSQMIDPVLDELDVIDRAYHLEVSSPGIDRPLKTEADFKRHAGATVQVSLYQQFLGCKHFAGTLLSYTDGSVCIDLDLELQEKLLSAKAYKTFLLSLAATAGLQAVKVKDIDFELLPTEITFAPQEWSHVKRYCEL